MRSAISIIIMALLPTLLWAQSADTRPTCLPNSSAQQAIDGWVTAVTWQCRPVSGTNQRYWDRFYAAADLANLPAGAGAVYDAFKIGKSGVLASGVALINRSINDPAFAGVMSKARALAASQERIATRVTADGKTCACDLIKPDVSQYLWQCRLAAAPAGALVPCKPQ